MYNRLRDQGSILLGILVGRLRTRAVPSRTEYCPKFWSEESKTVLPKAYQEEGAPSTA